jgi:hypothetical protein
MSRFSTPNIGPFKNGPWAVQRCHDGPGNATIQKDPLYQCDNLGYRNKSLIPLVMDTEPQDAGMESEYSELELIQNGELVAAVCREISCLGLLLICHGCDDVEVEIVGFLVSEQNEEARALCRSCVRKLARYRGIV